MINIAVIALAIAVACLTINTITFTKGQKWSRIKPILGLKKENMMEV